MKRRIIRKWFWVWEFEEEEKWLADMAERGWVLDGVGFCKYKFVSCEPGEYATRLEMMEWAPSTIEGQDYIRFVEDTGAEFVGNYMRWVYFRKKTADGPFDLFSDVDSRIRHLDRIMKLVGAIGAANLLIGISNLKTAGLVNLLCAGLLGFAWHRLNLKKTRLQTERSLHE